MNLDGTANLRGKVAIVTGAGQGVGQCHAELLASLGAAVVVNDLGVTAEKVAAGIVERGGRAVPHLGSASDWDAAGVMVQTAVAEFGDLHILVNNAGITRDAMSFSMTEAQFDAVIDVHVKGHFAPSHHAAAYWRAQAKALGTIDDKHSEAPVGRRIINTSSEAGLFGSAAQGNYASAKGAILTMTMVLARELGRYGVTANVIAPRARTPMTADVTERFAAPTDGSFDRYAPENISPIVAWLASDASAGVSGHAFIVIGDDIHLIRPTEIASTISAGGEAWTPDAIAEHIGELFGEIPTGVPPFGGPPM
jgi:NAD(P)-dependent dehydrogenase (short-subunit alcohol dehydrogenase family)